MTQHNNSDAKMKADPTPDMAVENWLQALERQGKSQHTLAAYRRGVAHFVQWNALTYGTPFDPAVIVPRDVRDWKTHQQVVEKTAPATTNQRLVALSRFFAWAVKQGIAHNNPTEDVGSIHLPQRQPKGLDRRDLRRLLRAVHASGNLRDIAVIEVLAATGLRVGELLALQIGDVELKERSGKLTVRREAWQLSGSADRECKQCGIIGHHSEADHPGALMAGAGRAKPP
jgi:site-specific recombinase XerD